MAKIEITAGTPGQTRITVDGQDLSVRGYRLSSSVYELPVLELDVPVLEGRIRGEAGVVLAPSVHGALCALGWVPPAEAERLRAAVESAAAGYERIDGGTEQVKVYAADVAAKIRAIIDPPEPEQGADDAG